MLNKISKRDWIYLLLFFMLGFFLIVQLRSLQSDYKYTAIGTQEALLEKIEVESRQVDEYIRQIEELEVKIEILEEYGDDEERAVELLKAELDSIKDFAYATELVGPGVIIIISDAERELMENENPNNLLVHDLDIQALVDDLREAGAEAISINGERYVFGVSSIECTGPSIKINDRIYSQPFIISAIGDKKYLESAINAPGHYGEVLKSYGLFVEVNTSVNVRVPAYDGDFVYRYIE